MPHSIIHGNACFAYFNKIWGIPSPHRTSRYRRRILMPARTSAVVRYNVQAAVVGMVSQSMARTRDLP
jgi:hypothetical protein